jgi:hypothetical protein
MRLMRTSIFSKNNEERLTQNYQRAKYFCPNPPTKGTHIETRERFK